MYRGKRRCKTVVEGGQCELRRSLAKLAGSTFDFNLNALFWPLAPLLFIGHFLVGWRNKGVNEIYLMMWRDANLRTSAAIPASFWSFELDPG